MSFVFVFINIKATENENHDLDRLNNSSDKTKHDFVRHIMLLIFIFWSIDKIRRNIWELNRTFTIALNNTTGATCEAGNADHSSETQWFLHPLFEWLLVAHRKQRHDKKKRNFQQYFSYTVVVTFIGGWNRNIPRKPPTCRKSLTNFIT